MREQISLAGFDEAKATDRLFFALFPDDAAATCIAQRAKYLRDELGLKGKPLEAKRFHITLHHVDDYASLPPAVVARAIEAASTVTAAPFEVRFDRAMSFAGRAGNRPFVLRGDDPDALMDFQRKLVAALNKAGVKSRKVGAPYTPHVTLLYDDVLVEERSIEPVSWMARKFVLVHSLLGRTTHIPLACWPLAH